MKELLEKILGQIKKTPEVVRAYEDLYHICLETQKTDIGKPKTNPKTEGFYEIA